jgi:GAF domain-containing protein
MNHDDVRLVESLRELTSLLLNLESVEHALEQTARLAARVVVEDGHCGITLRRDSQPYTAAFSSPLAIAVDELQYDERTGPCLQTLTTGEIIRVDNLVEETRWPPYTERALEAGIGSSLSLPLQAGPEGPTVGALNLYSTRSHAFGHTEQELGVTIADHAGITIAAAVRYAERVQLTEQLQTALASREVIAQAIGIVMAGRQCTPDEAFAQLRSASQRSNRKLRVIATELVEKTAKQKPE